LTLLVEPGGSAAIFWGWSCAALSLAGFVSVYAFDRVEGMRREPAVATVPEQLGRAGVVPFPDSAAPSEDAQNMENMVVEPLFSTEDGGRVSV
ncbi:hypothetical protein, partial [Microbacterium sp. Bi128]|uniref:hypothetical protein n=1 Tax=Microbacterium sp. Bi128 TaxID=2821115 RepID=UPI001E3EBA74